MTKPIEHATDQCTAMTKGSDYTVRCGHRPIKGGTVCRLHGGVLPHVKSRAAIRVARSDAERKALQRLRDRTGLPTQDALAEMERLAAEVTVFKDICRERLEELWAADEIRYEGKAGEQLRAEVALYERALDRCNTVLATQVRLGIAERRQKLNEAQALIIAAAIRNILARLGLTADQKVIAGQVVPEELRAISAAVSPDA